MTVQIDRDLYCVYCGIGPFKESSEEAQLHRSHIITENNPKESKIDGKDDYSKVDVNEWNQRIEEQDNELIEIKEKGERQDPEITAYQITQHLVLKQHVIGKDEIKEHLDSWQRFRRYKWDSKQIRKIIDSVWSNKKTFKQIKLIAYQLGIERTPILLDKGQTIEVAEWLRGRYHIKRIDIDGKLLFFNDYFYEQRAGELIKRKARECLSVSTKTDMNEILSYIEDTSELITLSDIEKHVHLKCLLNGVYNIKTREFSNGVFDPKHIILNQIPHNFDESNSYERIDKVVVSIISNNNDRQSFYDWISTCLHPYTGIDFQFTGVGQSGTGKSQLCDLVVFTLGEDNVSEASIHSIAKDPTTQLDTAYKMANIDRDMSNGDINHPEIIKKWITQDRFRARAIFEHSGDFRPTSRWLGMSNDLYEIPNHDDAQAIYERTHLVRIENKFRGQENQINKIIEKVSTDEQLNGFITYLLKNAAEIYENQKIHHPMSCKAVSEIWNQHGNRIREFIKKWFVKDPEYKTERQEVFDKWLNHSLDKEFPSKGRDTFYDQFEEIVGMYAISTRRDSIPGRYYVGLRLLNKSEIELKKEDDTSYD